MRKLVCLCLAMVVVLSACSSGGTSSGIGDATGRWTVNLVSRTSSFQTTGSMTLTQPQPLLGAVAPSETGILAHLAPIIGVQPAMAQILPPRAIAPVSGVMAFGPNECLEGGVVQGNLVGEQIEFGLISTNGAVVVFQGTTKLGGSTVTTDPGAVVFGFMEGLYTITEGFDLPEIPVEGTVPATPSIEIGGESDCAGQSGNWSAVLIQ